MQILDYANKQWAGLVQASVYIFLFISNNKLHINFYVAIIIDCMLGLARPSVCLSFTYCF